MKKNLSLIFLFALTFLFSQSSMFAPYEAWFQNSGTVTIQSDNSMIYYTVDGTEPTLNSPSAVNQIAIPVSQTTTFKAFSVRYGITSPVETVKYYVGTYPTPRLFFKPPASWTSSCAYSNIIEPRTMVDFWEPGQQMPSACEGWKKVNASFAVGHITFNNCLVYSPFWETSPSFMTATDIFYDFSNGLITDPPACLLASSEVSGKAVSIKIFPNPVQEILKVDSEIKFLSYEITDASGKLFESKMLVNNQVNVSKLSSGLYFLKLMNADQGLHYIRFIKK